MNFALLNDAQPPVAYKRVLDENLWRDALVKKLNT